MDTLAVHCLGRILFSSVNSLLELWIKLLYISFPITDLLSPADHIFKLYFIIGIFQSWDYFKAYFLSFSILSPPLVLFLLFLVDFWFILVKLVKFHFLIVLSRIIEWRWLIARKPLHLYHRKIPTEGLISNHSFY